MITRDVCSRPTQGTKSAFLGATLLLCGILTASCAGQTVKSPAASPPVRFGPPPTPPVRFAPPPACLTVPACEHFPCDDGASINLVGPFSAAVPAYGTQPGCPDYILDIANSPPQPTASGTLRVAPLKQPDPCDGSKLDVYVYGHSTTGFTPIPAMTINETQIELQGRCGLSDVLETFGGMPEYDRFRLLAIGIKGDGTQLPLSVSLVAAGH